MQYKFIAYNFDDGIIKGEIDARDEVEARSSVSNRGLKLLELAPSRRMPGIEELFPSFNKVGNRDLIRFLRQIATMLGSGASVQKTLEMLQSDNRNRMMRLVLNKIRADLDDGTTLSTAMADHPNVFNPVFISVVKVGESTGRLGPSLEQLADILEQEQEAKSRVMRTMMMPMINLVAAGIMLIIMMTIVLPPIFKTFDNGKNQIPMMMRIAMGISNILTQNWLYILVGGIVMIPVIILLRKIDRVNYEIDKFKLKLPAMGSLLVAMQLSAFSRTVAILLNSGVPLADALNLATAGVSNIPLRMAFEDAEDSLLNGLEIAEALKRHSVVPDMWVELVMIGEKSNSLEKTMNDLANAYQKQAENNLSGLLSILEPASTLVVGGVVAFLAMSNVQMVQSSLSSIGQ
ncbi:MAG: type II secretion system F family protein [Chloroflexi bacterium]|nr:type II secretion system F family protein [Chloroflexota bacterium]